MSQNITNDLQPADPKSVLFQIWKAKQSGEISEDDYYKQTAIYSAQNLGSYFPRRFPKPSPAIQSYWSDRKSSISKRDKFLAKQNGDWVYEVSKVIFENTADIEFMKWCIEKIKNIGMDSLVKNLESRILSYNSIQCPVEEYRLAIKTQDLDRKERSQ